MIREKITNIQKTFYVTGDGKEFESFIKAKRHEEELTLPERQIETKCIEIKTEDCWPNCYNIKDKEDYRYLMIKVWKHNAMGEFTTPGWYIAFKTDGGDYPDSYYVIKAEEYMATLQADIEEIKHLTNS